MGDNSGLQSWGIALLRVVVGVVFFVHGCQKLFVFHIAGVVGFFQHFVIPAPTFSAPVVTVVEFVGGAALLLGLGTRIAALLLTFDMLGAIAFVHAKNGFFMPTGYEFAMTLAAANICLLLAGAGTASIDSLIRKKP